MLPLAEMGHEIVGRVVKLGPDAKGVKLWRSAHRVPLAWLRPLREMPAEEDNMCLTPRSLGVYANGGYGTHVIAPHPRHLVDPGTLDPAVAATYARSGHHGLFGDPQGNADTAERGNRRGGSGRPWP